MMKKLFAKMKESKAVKKVATVTSAMTMALGAYLYSSTPTFAAPNTGNADLDTLVGAMETGATSMKTAAMYIIGFVILIAVVLLGARWAWGVFRGWMAAAK